MLEGLVYLLIKVVLIYYTFSIPLKLWRRYYYSKVKSIMIVLGSGGHTTEIITMLKKLDFNKFVRIYFVHSHNDSNSVKKLRENIEIDKIKDKIEIMSLYRSRQVGQSYFSSIFTTLFAFLHSILLIIKTRPNLLVTNGPGVSLPLCYIGFILNKMCVLHEFKILFIESYCRTVSLSLCGKLIRPIVDKFIVLWKNLETSKQKYLGKIL